jgi:predicted LPLAT superfamily acyltransferase
MLDRMRRRVTAAAVRGALVAGRRLRPHHSLGLGRFAAHAAGLPNPLRWRLARHLQLAGLEPTSERLDRYFRLLGHWLGRSLAVYHRGFVGSGVAQLFDFADPAGHLDAALSAGRGAILVGFHYHCHELACAALARRYPIVALVRESNDPRRDAVKRRWYEAAGIEIVLRSRRHASKLAEALDFLWVLRDNKVLAITPDVLGPPELGVPVELLGRTVNLPPGMIALAMGLGCPVIYSWPEWSSATGLDRLTVRLDEPRTYSKRGDRTATLARGMQDWATCFDAFLRREPEAWLFWLDKRWSRHWRGAR